MSNDLTTRFLETLQSIRGAGRFCTQGSIPFTFPGIRLKSGEELAFPLPPSQARAVRDAAEAAPYGMGAETRHDESVRRCWQIDAAELEWSQPGWQKNVDKLAQQIAEDLGVAGKVTACAYKLLLYEKGGFFLPHRDTEKVPGMFGSLILCLPSKHEGGTLLVRHQGQEERVDFSASQDPAQLRYAAFFADCEHEVLPVTQGFRLCLAYNLIFPRGSKAKPPSASVGAAGLLLPGLRHVAGAAGNDLTAILLEHRYTEDGLSIAALKGDDRARAGALFETAELAGLTARLALVSLYQMGALEVDYDESYQRSRSRRGSSRGYREDSTAEGEMGEVYEETLTIDHWRTPADRRDNMGSFDIGSERILSLASLGEGEPDEKYAEGFTGNAGCTMEHWYRRAAIVVWPQEGGPSLQARYNFRTTCESFHEMAARNSKGAKVGPLGTALLDEAVRRLAKASEYEAAALASSMTPLLHGIALSGAADLFQRMMKPNFLAVFVQANRDIWQAMVRAFGHRAVDFLLHQTSSANLSRHLNALFHSLDAALVNAPDLAQKMAPQISAWLTAVDQQPDYRFRSESPVSFAQRWHFSLAASCLVTDKAERTTLGRALWSQGGLPHLRDVLAPALLEKSHRSWFPNPRSLAPDLLTAAMNTLAAECARPLPPYPDWSRPVPAVEFRAPLIQELLAFMAEPSAPDHRFRRRQDERSMIEHFVRQHDLDLNLTTDTKGSPHTLVCRKNDASHQKALKRRAADAKLLQRLRGLEIEGEEA